MGIDLASLSRHQAVSAFPPADASMGDRTDMAEPRWLTIARGQLGVHEVPGPKSNPSVENYYLGAIGKRLRDDVPWCAAFVGWALRKAGVKPSNSLAAASYLKWGERIEPKPGAIAVFNHHVAFYVEDTPDGDSIYVLGGNQQDAVTIERKHKGAVLAYRWPIGAKE